MSAKVEQATGKGAEDEVLEKVSHKVLLEQRTGQLNKVLCIGLPRVSGMVM